MRVYKYRIRIKDISVRILLTVFLLNRKHILSEFTNNRMNERFFHLIFS